MIVKYVSGAVGLPNLLPYMYFFWSRDVRNNYYTETPEKYAQQHIQRLVYALNQPYTRNGIQSAFSNTSVFDRPYLEALFGGAEFPDGTFMIDEIDGIMEFQKIYLETMAEIRTHNMMTFPVNSISLLRQDGKFIDEDFARYACEHNRRWNDSNLFIDSSVTSLSNCCRLKSNIEDLGYFNSIGGISIEIVDGYFGAVFARSGLATKQGLRPSNCVGVIDSDYRGEIMVSLRNDSAVTRVISPNDRIAQLVILPYQAVEFNEVEELSDTQRGEGGFGSTGIGLTKEESASWEQLSLFNKEYTTSNDTYTVTVE